MTISRVKPGGWAFAANLTSAEANQLDADHAKAVDKTGDVVPGAIHLGNGGTLIVDAETADTTIDGNQTLPGTGTPFVLTVVDTTGFPSSGGATIAPVTPGALIHFDYTGLTGTTFVGCTSPSTATVITGQKVLNGGFIELASGGTLLGDPGSSIDHSGSAFLRGSVIMKSGATTTIERPAVLGTGGTLTTANGDGARITLDDDDYVQLGATGPHAGRVQERMVPLASFAGAVYYVSVGGGSPSLDPTLGVVIGAAGATVKLALPIPLTWNGATLSKVTCYLTPANAHAALPAVAPYMNVRRHSIAAGDSIFGGPDDLGVTTQPIALPGLVGTWNNSLIKSWDYVCTVNNDLDPTQYVYWVEITDENGANSIAGNAYHALKLTYALTDLRPA